MDNNPLRQYFRRPSIYIALPSGGKYYDRDTFEPTQNGEIAVFPMTAIDEFTSKTPDAVLNGSAVVSIIESCVPNIKNAWNINTIDLEAILIAIRIASSGDTMEIGSTCPSCENEANYDVNLMDMMGAQRDINYDETLKVNQLSIRFKPLSYKESNQNSLSNFSIQKAMMEIDAIEDSAQREKLMAETVKKLNDFMTELVTATIASIQTPESIVTEPHFIRDFLHHCDRNTSKAIKDKSLELKNRNQVKPMKLKCLNCEHEYEQQLVLNISDFFE
jgi:hypothetical protein